MWVDQVVESGLISLLSVVFCGCFSYGFEWVLWVWPWVFSGFCLWRWWWVLFLVVGVDFFFHNGGGRVGSFLLWCGRLCLDWWQQQWVILG